MSTILYELPDRYVLDTGQVVGKHVRAIRDVLAGKDLSGKWYIDSPDLERFVETQKDTPIRWTSGEPEQPPEQTRVWQIPQSYKDLDLHGHLRALLIDFLSEHDDLDAKVYLARFDREWALILAKGMQDFIRALIYLIDTFEEKKVVWGVGRGSSVESLILFLIRVHRIDPILYEIELEHFFRS